MSADYRYHYGPAAWALTICLTVLLVGLTMFTVLWDAVNGWRKRRRDSRSAGRTGTEGR